MPRYIPTIGMEVHIELASRSKMFCACPHPSAVSEPNAAVCPVCLGLPGALPTVNAGAARLGLRAACALNAEVSARLPFERKNYAYPDLAKGYQLSQWALPVGRGGFLDLPASEIDPDLDLHDAPGGGLRVRFRRAHLEEDTARLLHGISGARLDANRSGAPLIEIVTDPCFHSARAAEAYVRRLRTLMVFHRVSRCRPEAGEMRVEANVSIAPEGAATPGTRVEIKNQAGFQYMRAAIEYEARRQASLLDSGQRVLQETRGFDPARGETFPQRKKEDAHDYRYFPDPDLPPPSMPEAWLAEEKARVAESPEAYMERLAAAGLSAKTIEAVVAQDALGFLREAEHALPAKGAHAADAGAGVDLMAKRLVNDVFTVMNRAGRALPDGRLAPEALAATAALEARGRLDAKGTRAVLEALFLEGGDPEETARPFLRDAEDGQAADDGALRQIVETVLAEQPGWVADFRAGKTAVRNAILGAAMKKLARKGDPKAIGAMIDQLLV